ncbi:MAG: hypothetical protein ACI86M_002919 [Saprospiraceae bacterium]|jgi:hypothetical protein
MKNHFLSGLLILSIIILSACAANKPWYKNEIERPVTTTGNNSSIDLNDIDYEIFMVGDIYNENKNISGSNVVNLIKTQLRPNSDNQSVVFLGNTLGKNGVPDQEDPGFLQTNKDIEHCIRELKNNTDKVYFIPGNNEWSNGHSYDLHGIQNSENFIEEKVGGKNILVPSQGCGQPKVVSLTDDLILVLIDSQWLLQGDNTSERKRSSCEIDNELEFVTALKNVFARNKNKNIVIASHHPVYSNGITGGNYPAKNHLFPLPILGTIINGVRQLAVNSQKMGHPQYEAYRSAMQLALANFEGIISSSAHDKNMQYILNGDNHFVIAGSGAEIDYVRKGGLAEFAAMEYGFAKITHTKELELWLEFFKEDPKAPNKAISIYRKRLYKKEIIDYSNKSVYKDLDAYPKFKKTAASKLYSKGTIGMGETYRKEWSTEIDAPLLLLDEIEGGLTPVQQGGGFQTKSLRLENRDGRQWVVRSIDKDIKKIVPPALRNTFAENVMQDGLSAAHPYGAFAIPELAEAAEIYHANPKFVWLPNQKALGNYNLDFANRLYLFEERPGGNMDGHPTYGNSKKSISTADLVDKLAKSHKHKVDQEYVLKARLFDLLVGDWDRHDDQWRWGIYADEAFPDKKIYRAIPRDRDQVFFKNDGVLNYIASRKFFTPSLRKFDDDIDMVDGLSFNARHFDRHFLSEMTLDKYETIASTLANNITDEVIDKAFQAWPKEIYKISGDRIKEKLKNRRAKLQKYAKELYLYLSKEVTAIGTNSDDIFEIEALDNNLLKVDVYQQSKSNKHLIWSRILDGKHTNELRLFGLKDNDTFLFTGEKKSSIKVRVVGGSGEDKVKNNADNISIIVYDKPQGMNLEGKTVKSKIKDERGINRFDRLDWKMNKSIHFPMISFYTDEGIGLSYNLWWIKNGFRKNPYKSSHTLSLSYFNANTALVGSYKGHWPDAFGKNWDFQLSIDGRGPTFSQFFYGLGNEYIDYTKIFPDNENAGAPSFFIVRGTNIDLNPNFIKNIGNGNSISIKPMVSYINLSDEITDEERFVNLEQSERNIEDFKSKLYTGIGLEFESMRMNNLVIPTSGYKYTLGADYKQSLSNSDFSNVTLNTNLTAYIPFTATHSFLLATQIGGQYTFGDYEFFHANFLTNTSRLRGYKTNRFAGDGLVYHASDLRIRLLQGAGKFKTGIGLYGSFDYGKVFLEGEDADDWHTSYGGGVYLTPLDLIGFKIGYHIGREDTQFSIGGALTF